MESAFVKPVSVDSTSSGTFHTVNSNILREYGNSRRVSVGRIAFVAGLIAVAAALGYSSYHFLHQGEAELADAEYEAKIGRAISLLGTISTNKLLGCFAVSKIVANTNPDASDWPQVSVPGYHDIVSDISPTSIVGGMSVAPMLFSAEEMASFEDFAYGKFAELFPDETVAVSSFGKGIWGHDESLDVDLFPDRRFHRTNVSSSWGSPFNFSSPKFLHSRGNHNLLLMDSHAQAEQGHAVDGAYICSMERAMAEDPSQMDCQTVSDIIPPRNPKEKSLGPGAFIVTPIYPRNEPTTMKGFIFAKINWIEILHAIGLDDITGVDVVISTSSGSFTYSVVDGNVLFQGEGDLHDSSQSHNQASKLDFLQSGRLSNASVVYKLAFYPNDEFYDTYYTSTPVIASVSVVLIVLCTSIFFVLYDFFVRKEFNNKQELLHAKRQFVRFVSHEVRTPLNSVVMGLTLIQEELAKALGYEQSEEVPEDASHNSNSANMSECVKETCLPRVSSWYQLTQEVQGNAQTSVDVLNDLLNYDKVEAGNLSLELTVVPIWALIQKTVFEFKLPSTKKEITLLVELPENITELSCQKVVGDVIRLTQVLRNLLSNAIKFTPTGGTITITASSQAAPVRDSSQDAFELRNKECIKLDRSGTLVLEVRDSGAGMSKEQLSQLFRQGVQFNVNELQAGNGSGLGLYIAKGIVEQHCGSLRASSPGLGLGTSFTMNVPLYHVEDSPKTEFSREMTTFTSNTYEQSPLKILVVDDAASNRKLLMRLLGNRGHTCEGAENGQQCMEILQSSTKEDHPFDMILLDYEMPVMNGPAAAKAIRNLGCDVFLVGVTGNMLAEDVDFFKSCGVNAVLAKPFQISQLEELCMEYNIQGYHSSNV